MQERASLPYLGDRPIVLVPTSTEDTGPSHLQNPASTLSLCLICTPVGLKYPTWFLWPAPSFEGSVVAATMSLDGQSGQRRRNSSVSIRGSFDVVLEAVSPFTVLGGVT